MGAVSVDSGSERDGGGEIIITNVNKAHISMH